jgi:hypothetical protein
MLVGGDTKLQMCAGGYGRRLRARVAAPSTLDGRTRHRHIARVRIVIQRWEANNVSDTPRYLSVGSGGQKGTQSPYCSLGI